MISGGVEIEDPFRIALAAVVLSMAAIRIYYRRLAAREGGRSTVLESKPKVLVLGLSGLFGLGIVVTYLFDPRLMAWSALPLPDWLRWVGLVSGAAGLVLLWRVHQALRENFSSVLHVRDEHKLVTSGPYRRVRHPMYTAFYLLVSSFFLLSANWLIGLLWVVGLTLIIAPRVSREEAAMTEEFGDLYREYMGRTGRFLPPLGRAQ